MGLHPGERASVPLALRPRLHVDRLRPLHACDDSRRGRAGGARVVGGERGEGVRPPLGGEMKRYLLPAIAAAAVFLMACGQNVSSAAANEEQKKHTCIWGVGVSSLRAVGVGG